MGHIPKAEFWNLVDRKLKIDAWMLFELTNAGLANEYAKLTLDDLREPDQHRGRIIDNTTIKMAVVNMAAAEVRIVLQDFAAPNTWKVDILIPLLDPHIVLGCTTFSWTSGYGVQRYREVKVSTTDTMLIVKMKVRGTHRSRVDEAISAFLAAMEGRLSDISALIDEYNASLPYIVRTDLMVLPSQRRQEAMLAA